MNLSGLEEFTPSCKCPQCGSYNTEITYTKPRKQRRGHRCHDCQRPFQSEMSDTPEAEPSPEEVQLARQRYSNAIPKDKRGTWTRVGVFIRVNFAERQASKGYAVYRCSVCQKTSLLSRDQFRSRSKCTCQLPPKQKVPEKAPADLADQARRAGIPINVVRQRLRRCWPLERALSRLVLTKTKKGES